MPPEADQAPSSHVSAALHHLRHMVGLCAVTVVLASLLHLLVFGFVHFTDRAWTTIENERASADLKVVASSGNTEEIRTISGGPDATNWVAGKSRVDSGMADAAAVAVTIDRVPSSFGVLLEGVSRWSTTLGIVACLGLGIACGLGVIVGSGASVPGIERAVTSATWATLLALIAIPWRDAFPSIAFPGMFASYGAMASISAHVASGQTSGTAAIATHVLLPLAALSIALVALVKFRGGVARGIVIRSASAMDEAIEREMASIRKKGVGSHFGVQISGSLNRALGETNVALAGGESKRAPESPADLGKRPI